VIELGASRVCSLYEYVLVKESYNQMMRDLDWGTPTQQDDLALASRPEIRIRDVAGYPRSRRRRRARPDALELLAFSTWRQTGI